jgi:hypothetical protein
MKKMIWLFMGIGSTVGGALPTLWGDTFFGMTSVILTAVGGLLGIWLAVKASQYFGL